MDWKELLNEVEARGLSGASAIARLAWACETANGVDQHAAPDIQEIADELSALRARVKELEEEQVKISEAIRVGSTPQILVENVILTMTEYDSAMQNWNYHRVRGEKLETALEEAREVIIPLARVGEILGDRPDNAFIWAENSIFREPVRLSVKDAYRARDWMEKWSHLCPKKT